MAPGGFIFGLAGYRLKPEEKDFFRASDPWGFILFARNLDTPGQIRALTSELREAVGRQAPVFIDQEGGRVQRLRAPDWQEWQPPLDLCQHLGDRAPQALRLMYRVISAELLDLGIDGNCAPLGDIAGPGTHPILRNRCYGETVEAVVPCARAVAEAQLESGVLPVVKHMPGLGAATTDSHLELPRVGADQMTLFQRDFRAFNALADLPIGMTCHAVFEALSDLPGTLSPEIIALIRDEIGFHGLLMTDDIAMGALRGGSIGERAASARAAGCDLVLHCNGGLLQMEDVAATGPLTAEGQARSEAALARRARPGRVDIAATRAEFDAMFENAS